MENEERKFSERINYVEDTSTGKIVLVGSMVNYGGVFSADNELELKCIAKAFLDSHINHAKILLKFDEPFDLKKLSSQEWDAREDNIVYWELERTKRLISKDEIQEKWKTLIANKITGALKILSNGSVDDIIKYGKLSQNLTESIMTALINQPND